VAALGAGPPPPECRWGRRPHRGATACRLLERDNRGVDSPGVEGDSRLGELLEVERDEGLRAAARVAVMRAVFGLPHRCSSPAGWCEWHSWCRFFPRWWLFIYIYR